MTDILLEGVSIEVPNNGIECTFNPNGICILCEKVCSNVIGRPDWCPLKDLGKHGKLYDEKDLLEYAFTDKNMWKYDMTDLEDFLMDVPPVAQGNIDIDGVLRLRGN